MSNCQLVIKLLYNLFYYLHIKNILFDPISVFCDEVVDSEIGATATLISFDPTILLIAAMMTNT